MEINKEYFKYFTFLLGFVILFLLENQTTWIYLAIIAIISILIYLVKSFGKENLFKYLAIIFALLVFLLEIGSKEQKWAIYLAIISLFIWIIKTKLSSCE